MLFNYKAVDGGGRPVTGGIDAINIEAAINSLQRRGFVITTIAPASAPSFLEKNISLWSRVKAKDIVIVSRQLATLFGAQVSALRIFRLLAVETEQSTLKSVFLDISDDLQGGSSISKALARHPDVFSNFYVNMVRSGEEAGKLDKTFEFLADHLDRNYEVTSKARNALVYPAFVVITFIVVVVLMLTNVIPNISSILTESGKEIPFYTRAVLALSDFFVHYGIFILIAAIATAFLLWRFSKTPEGRISFDEVRLKLPYLGDLYRKLYLSRISDNLHTMLLSAIPIVKSLEITAEVVDSALYEEVLRDAIESVKAGSSIADSFARSPLVPGIMVQMIKVGEESGELGNLLDTLAKFYRREVSNAIDTLLGLIEPALIIFLGLGVGFLMASVLIPIYSITG